MRHTPLLTTSLFLCTFLFSFQVSAARQQSGDTPRQMEGGWTTFIRGGDIYQGNADLDDGGSYTANRFNIQAGHGYSWSRRTAVLLALSYSNDSYSFSGNKPGSLAAMDPWESVNSYSVSSPMRMGVSENWSAFAIPSMRSTGESGADFNETITGGVITGFSYRFSDRLTIGPGVGVMSQLEDSASVFPFLVIDWKITDRISLETGRGLAATQGPGLTLTYRMDQSWSFGMGGRYEKLRFRLDGNGENGGGIGEETSVPLFLSGSYNFSRKVRISFVCGVEVGAELILEDSDGNTIKEESVDPSLFGGNIQCETVGENRNARRSRGGLPTT